jgi:hypothetical protein
MHETILIAGICSYLLGSELPADYQLPPPPGKFVGQAVPPAKQAAGVAAGTPLVATSYFYWYDAQSKTHVINADGTDGLTDHPPTLEGFSYKNVAWHEKQLRDMIDAGIDVLLPVYWGAPDGSEAWSDEGLPPLVAAREKLLQEGLKPPAIGMFYDTSTLQCNRSGYHVDCTTSAGRRWFYGTIRNFFSAIPPQHRATINGKPIVFLYTRAFAKNVDAELFPAVRKMFKRDFGSDLYLVKMIDWPGKADSEYAWGAALNPTLLATAGIGPGYNDSAVPGRKPTIRDRENGEFYRRAWEDLLRLPVAKRPWLVHLETWSEYHEGTDLAESKEYGRQYIELTRRYADLFHAKRQIE